MESARSLLSKLKDPPPQVSSLPALETVKIEPVEASPPPKPKTPKTNVAKQNPAVEIMSDIEGFTDWNLGMVRDFISCMDRARRKYADMKKGLRTEIRDLRRTVSTVLCVEVIN